MKNLIKIFIITTLLLPSFAFAASTIFELLKTISDLISSVIPVITAFGFAYFLYGIVKFIMAASDDISGKTAAKAVIINGIIGLFVMVSVWGLVDILQSTVLGGMGTPASIPATRIP